MDSVPPKGLSERDALPASIAMANGAAQSPGIPPFEPDQPTPAKITIKFD